MPVLRNGALTGQAFDALHARRVHMWNVRLFACVSQVPPVSPPGLQSAVAVQVGRAGALMLGPVVPLLQNGLKLFGWLIPGTPSDFENTSVVPDSSLRRKACL